MLSRDPVWASVGDEEHSVSVHLFRQCAHRIMAVVQILREEGWTITDEEVSSFLSVSSVLQREVALHTPTVDDVSLMEVFNKDWLASRGLLVNGGGPDVLFNPRVGEADRLSECVSALLNPANSAGDTDAPAAESSDEGGDDPSSKKTPPVGSSAKSDEIMDVRRRAEEELDFEAEEEDLDERAASVIEVGTDEENGSSSGESSSEEGSESGSDDDVQPLKSSSYAAAAASPVHRKVSLKNSPASGSGASQSPSSNRG